MRRLPEIAPRAPSLPWLGMVAFTLVLCALFAAFAEVELARPLANKHESLLPGLTTEPLLPPRRGLVVTSVRNQSEAQHDGVAVGDDVLQVNGLPADKGLSRNLHLSKGGSAELRLQLLHGGEIRNVVLHPHVR